MREHLSIRFQRKGVGRVPGSNIEMKGAKRSAAESCRKKKMMGGYCYPDHAWDWDHGPHTTRTMTRTRCTTKIY